MTHTFGAVRVCATLYMLSHATSVIASDVRAELLAKYEPHAAALLDHYRAVRVRYQFRQPGGKDREWLTRVTSVFDREHVRTDGEAWSVAPGGEPTGAGVPSTDLRNSKYKFEVKGDQEKGYVLGTMTPHGEIPSAWSVYTFPFADPWLRRTYLDLIRDPKSTVVEVKSGTRRGRQAVAVTLEYDFVNVHTRQPDRGRAIYSFDPTAGWACVGERPVPTPGKTESVGEAVYRYATRDGWPVPTQYEQWLIPADDSNPGRLRVASVVDEYSPIPALNDADFRLSAFGLPEPTGVVWPTRSNRWLWLLGAVGLFGGLALLGWRFRRRAGFRTQVVHPDSH